MLAALGRRWRNCDSRCSVLEQVDVYCPSPDFTSRCADCRADTRGHFNFVSQSVTNSRCAPSCGGTREKWGGGAHQFFSTGALCPPPLANCFRRHWRRWISADPTADWSDPGQITFVSCPVYISSVSGSTIVAYIYSCLLHDRVLPSDCCCWSQ